MKLKSVNCVFRNTANIFFSTILNDSLIYRFSHVRLTLYDQSRLSSTVLSNGKTRICTTWPSFPIICRLLFIISTHNLVVSRNFLSNKTCFELFLSAHFLFWEILNWNLTFAVCRLPYMWNLNSLMLAFLRLVNRGKACLVKIYVYFDKQYQFLALQHTFQLQGMVST